MIKVKGKAPMTTYFITGRADNESHSPNISLSKMNGSGITNISSDLKQENEKSNNEAVIIVNEMPNKHSVDDNANFGSKFTDEEPGSPVNKQRGIIFVEKGIYEQTNQVHYKSTFGSKESLKLCAQSICEEDEDFVDDDGDTNEDIETVETVNKLDEMNKDIVLDFGGTDESELNKDDVSVRADDSDKALMQGIDLEEPVLSDASTVTKVCVVDSATGIDKSIEKQNNCDKSKSVDSINALNCDILISADELNDVNKSEMVETDNTEMNNIKEDLGKVNEAFTVDDNNEEEVKFNDFCGDTDRQTSSKSKTGFENVEICVGDYHGETNENFSAEGDNLSEPVDR